jgi:hypothetical protein
MRWARSSAWLTLAGTQSSSANTTWEAAVKVRPTPAAVIEPMNTLQLGSVWKRSTAAWRSSVCGLARQDHGGVAEGGLERVHDVVVVGEQDDLVDALLEHALDVLDDGRDLGHGHGVALAADLLEGQLVACWSLRAAAS